MQLEGELADVNRPADCEGVAETGQSAIRFGEVALNILKRTVRHGSGEKGLFWTYRIDPFL